MVGALLFLSYFTQFTYLDTDPIDTTAMSAIAISEAWK
jgi:hypothetical protein